MTKAVRLHEQGGPEVLKYEDVDLPAPAAGEAQVRHEAIGLNYIDVYLRSGLYPLPQLPWVIGMEGAGVVEAVGEGVSEVAVGDRVAYAAPPPSGAYAEARNMAAAYLVKLPDGISFEQGAAMMLQGMTVEYLIRRTYAVKAGETVLVHAAAGGVGLTAVEIGKVLGATVIATAGGPEKLEVARSRGADHLIDYRTADIRSEVRELTGGQGADVIYDPVGGDVFDASLRSLAWEG
ncbi:MAG: quinone oxidoreductase, partial [Alphaproteobacteria bacterium]|nr:quinone oxidoreductase [Alphaproteobacteria bacterium]